MQTLGKFLMIGGLLMLVAGVVVYFAGDKLSWLGKLPGDIRIKGDDFSFYFPVTTMILLSVIVSVVIALIRKFLN